MRFMYLALCIPTIALAAPKWTSSCGKVPGVADAVEFCVYENGPNPKATLWFMHGLGDDETVFQDPASHKDRESYAQFRDALPPVRIVAISYGWSWLLTAYPNRSMKPVTSTVQVFSSVIMPYFEKNYVLPKPYILFGQSMGGFNAATLCAAMPAVWAKCALLNSMLPTCDPFARIPTCNPLPGMIVKENFTEAQYETTKPVVLLSGARGVPPSYVTACKKDQYGLFEGPKQWHTAATALGFQSKWEPVMDSCDHFHWPVKSVLDFMFK